MLLDGSRSACYQLVMAGAAAGRLPSATARPQIEIPANTSRWAEKLRSHIVSSMIDMHHESNEKQP
jgi:hypothetical protein